MGRAEVIQSWIKGLPATLAKFACFSHIYCKHNEYSFSDEEHSNAICICGFNALMIFFFTVVKKCDKFEGLRC